MNAIELLKNYEHEIKNKFGVTKIGVFGSFVRGEEKLCGASCRCDETGCNCKKF